MKITESQKNLNALSSKDIVLYALYLLGGWQQRVATEDIALKCYQLAPSKFSWIKYPQYPDREPARFALEKAKKSNQGALVEGESERKRIIKNIGGWMLTSNGIKWMEDNKRRIEKYLGKQTPIGDRLPADRKVKELLNSLAFKKFGEMGDAAEISHAEFAESLVCTVNTGPKILNDRLDQLLSIAETSRREELKEYVAFCRNRFVSILGRRRSNEKA